MRMNETGRRIPRWLLNLMMLGGAMCVFALSLSLASAVPCNGETPDVQTDCGTETPCEKLDDFENVCKDSTGWYYKDQGIVNCKMATANDNCYDSPTLVIVCVCKYKCKQPDPSNGFCEKGDPFMVLEGKVMVHQCATHKKKIAHATCDLGG